MAHQHCLSVLIIIISCSLISKSKCSVIEALHDYMTEPELAYYFQSTAENPNIPDYEVVYMPSVVDNEDDADLTQYNFEAFQRPISLKLRRNDNLLSPTFTSYITEGNSSTPLNLTPTNCHYLHKDENSVAAISACDNHSMQGLVFLDNTTLEIHPLSARLQSLVKMEEPLLESSDINAVPHIVKRRVFARPMEMAPMVDFEALKTERAFSGTLTVELAMFFDEAAYKIFAPYMNYDDQKLQDMLLAYLNGVQALYHHPSLGTSLELVLIRLDIMKTQAGGMPHYEGERSKLLDSFCAYQSGINPRDDSDPKHWDMALYVSGLDFFAYENGKKSGVTMGLATVGGVCLDQYACVIAEFGTTNVFGKPYPSGGFTSVYILAHEIGHNLGMHHDSVGNSCPKEGYVMSPSRGTNGETQWSTCSADVMRKLGWAKCLEDGARSPKSLDHNRFLDSPGQIYTAKKQCEILLRDKDALVSPSQDLKTICFNLQCKTPHRSGYYFAGPALDGTQCANNKYCYGGECVAKTLRKPVKVVPGGWSKWKEEQCSSECLEKSKGYQMSRRQCNNPVPVNTDRGCEGSSIQFGICKDDKICKSKRLPVTDYASQKCAHFSRYLPQLDKTGAGLQAPHEEARVWMGCAIFCRRSDTGSFYTPRLELNDLGVSPYFPDGTWCHRQGSTNYYCLHHHCLPENFQFTKSGSGSFLQGLGEDIPFSQNAHPSDVIPPDVVSYLSLGPDGKPIKTVLKPGESLNPKDEDWETDDYVVVPGIMGRME